MSKKSGQLNVSITPEQQAFIDKLQKHRITGPELIRGLLDAAADFYDQNGWLSFPLKVSPEVFQIQGRDTEDKLVGSDSPLSSQLRTTKPRKRAV